MAFRRAFVALRAVATAAGGGGGKPAGRTIIGCDFCGSLNGRLQEEPRISITEGGPSWKKQGVVLCVSRRRGFGSASSTTSANVAHDSFHSPSTAAMPHARQQKEQRQRHLPSKVDGSTFPAPPRASGSSLHDPFMGKRPSLDQKQEQGQEQKLPGPVQAAPAATAKAAAAVDDKFHPKLSGPVEVFPLDTELHREIGAAIDTEMHRKLGEALPAATVAPGTALHPDVVAAHEKVMKKEAQATVTRLNFDDAAASYASCTNMELLRAYFVLRACAVRPLVENSETLLKIGYGVVGETVTNAILRKTFFAHFCAGETAEQVARRASALKARGIGGILDYAAEVDLRPAKERAERKAKRKAEGDDRLLLEEPAACRTYDYMGEAACDARLMTFLACVRAVRDQTPGGFAAVKLTALGDPVLLSQISTCAHLVRRLFEDFDSDRDGLVNHEEFQKGYRRWFVAESEEDESALFNLMKRLDPDDTGVIDYVGWSKQFRLDNLAEIVSRCRVAGPLAKAALREDGVALKKNMYKRIATLATAAAASEVRLMIDAEQSWLQPAIDNEVYSLQLEFNTEFPTIFTTYQCYLKNSLDRIKMDLDRAARGGYVWAGKLVRGAYMVSERERAKEEGYESPVFDTIEETHASYDAAVAVVLEHMAKGHRAEVMMATHNQKSIEHTISLMQKLGIRRQDGVSFGQLLGMADHVTFPLGTGGYQAYKYIPYGKVGETIPYLLRRAQENSGMLSGATHERGLLVKEIRRRLLGR